MSICMYITYYELTGKKADQRELAKLIKSFDKRSTFSYLARINNWLAMTPVHFDEDKFVQLQKQLSEDLVEAGLVQRLSKILNATSLVDRPIFHRQQLLVFMKRVLAEGLDEGGINPDDDRDFRYKIGKVLLMLNDVLVSEEQDERAKPGNPTEESESQRERVFSELLTQLLPVFELMNPPEIITSLIRTRQYISLSNKYHSALIDGKSLSKFFEEATAISLERFFQMVVGIYAALVHRFDEQPNNPPNFDISRSTHFSQLKFTESEIKSFFDLISTTLDKLASELTNGAANLLPPYDFTAFRKYPLLHLSEDILMVIDSTFLAEKVSTGPYHTILNSLNNENDRRRFLQHWGDVFEKYVNSKFQKLPENHHQFFPNPYFNSRVAAEAFDGIIDCPESLVVMEYKSGLLNLKSKCSGDVKELTKEMNSKYGLDGAIKQLSQNIEHLFHEVPERRKKLRKLCVSHVSKIYPVLIANETSLRFGLTHWRLRTWFETEIGKKKISKTVSVKPLLVLTVDDLETILPYLIKKDFTFCQFLEYYSTLKYSWCLDDRQRYQPMTSFLEVLDAFKQNCNIEFRENEEIDLEWKEIVNEIDKEFKPDV